ncbi:MAG: SBBP repeat-containing protein [Acidobacteriota bacterium]|nr:SBBP repeat-containing protein [Acidobacteriota bacterium]
MKVKTLKISSGVFLVLLVMLVLTFLKGDNVFSLQPAGQDGQQKVAVEEAKMNLAGLSLPFVANEGQWASQIKFQAGLFSGKFLVTDSHLVYSLTMATGKNDKMLPIHSEKPGEVGSSIERLTAGETEIDRRQISFRESFLTANGSLAAFSPEGEQMASSQISYFQGNNSSNWKSNLMSYRTLSLGAIYPGIEVRLKASANNVEKLFYLKPGSRAEDIKIKVEGVDSLEVNQAGELIINTGQGQLAMMKPAGFQEENGRQTKVEVAYELVGRNEYGFKISGAYDPGAALVIDPALSILPASTYLGGTGNDRGFCLAVDNSGNVYVAGYTLSTTADFPTTEGAYDRTYHGQYDIFVSRLSDDLKTLEASTYLGGLGTDYVYSLALDSSGYVYLAGMTSSGDFPVIAGAYQGTYLGGDYDTFVAKLSSDLSSLLASTYLGGSGTDYGASLLLDSSLNIYLTGTTSSSDFPVTAGAYSQTYKGGYDVFVVRLSNSLDALLASTFVGGSDYEIGSDLALGGAYLLSGSIQPPVSALRAGRIISGGKPDGKRAGKKQGGSDYMADNSSMGKNSGPGQLPVVNSYDYTIYVAGRTKSSDFPTTGGAYDQVFNGGYDGFIFQMSPDLSEICASTFLGGSGDDFIYSLAPDYQGNFVVAGYTASTDYPVKSNAYSKTLKGGYDLCISKLTGSLDYLLASTYIGGTEDDYCRAIAIDPYDNVYLAGWTKSNYFPTTAGAYNRMMAGGLDVMASKLSANLQGLLSSTYLGGASDDFAYALALDNAGNVYITGYTLSSAFPVPDEAYDDTLSGTDVFIAKFGVVDQYLVTVSVTGSGQVVSMDGGIDSNYDCSQVYDAGTNITLEAIPDSGYLFGGWGGDVYSTEESIMLTVNSDKTITAKFAPEGATYTLTILKSGSGSGLVTSDDEAIDCGTVCSQTYTSGTLIKLTATADEGSGFEGWSGDVSATAATIPVIINDNMTIIAIFGPPPLPDLTGEWHDITINRFLTRTTVITGFFELKNISQAEAGSGYSIAYYLSSNGTSLDLPLNTRAISKSLAADSSRTLMFSRNVQGSVNVSGKYLVAVIDSENKLTEEDENNNRIVYGPLP